MLVASELSSSLGGAAVLSACAMVARSLLLHPKNLKSPMLLSRSATSVSRTAVSLRTNWRTAE